MITIIQFSKVLAKLSSIQSKRELRSSELISNHFEGQCVMSDDDFWEMIDNLEADDSTITMYRKIEDSLTQFLRRNPVPKELMT